MSLGRRALSALYGSRFRLYSAAHSLLIVKDKDLDLIWVI